MNSGDISIKSMGLVFNKVIIKDIIEGKTDKLVSLLKMFKESGYPSELTLSPEGLQEALIDADLRKMDLDKLTEVIDLIKELKEVK